MSKPHEEHPFAVPYRNRDGEVVTITPEQFYAIWHALGVWSRMCEDEGSEQAEPAYWPTNARKSRALGRLLIDGKSLFADKPPSLFGAADYELWDWENS